MDNELILFDRLNIIKDTINKYGEENFYISFSGGKDSTLLHHLIDEALPNNKIPRVFINTGIEYTDIVKFVKDLAKEDDRIIIYNAGVHIPSMLRSKGYPFKSKTHAHYLGVYQRNGLTDYIKKYLKGVKEDGSQSIFRCPDRLKYQFDKSFSIPISEKCCDNLKKKPMHSFEKEYKKNIGIIGTRTAEGGARSIRKGCTVFDSKRNLKTFKPINPCTDEWCEWYIQSRNIKLCKLYYPPYNFTRTGCKGCPFALNLQEQLETMKRLLPSEYKQCNILWKPVYDEYRRIGYRLKEAEQR